MSPAYIRCPAGADHLLSGRLSTLLSCDNKHKRIVGHSQLGCSTAGNPQADVKMATAGLQGHVSRSDKTHRKRTTFSTLELMIRLDTLLAIYFVVKSSSTAVKSFFVSCEECHGYSELNSYGGYKMSKRAVTKCNWKVSK